MTIHRFHPDDPQSWQLWPQLEARIRDFSREYATDTPAEALLTHVRTMFVNSPQLLGAWAVLNEYQQITFHVVGWVEAYWGQPYILVHQCRGESGMDQREVSDPILREMAAWADELNAVYAASGSALRITAMRMMTERPDGWARYLHGIPTRTLTMLTVPLASWAVAKGDYNG